MRVGYTATARLQVDEILAHIVNDNPPAAVAVAAKGAVGRQRLFPRIGAETDEPGVYVKNCGNYQVDVANLAAYSECA